MAPAATAPDGITRDDYIAKARDEAAKRAGDRFDAMDTNHDGMISKEEFAAYGHRIGSVHIKDRVRGGGTVPLGTGAADLPAVFHGLSALGYGGDYVLQIARHESGQELPWIAQNRAWVAGQIEQALVSAQ